ncbi:MAG TPA: DUF695 domain-containing protein [Thermoanaerobaculia bacterium]
MIDQADPAEWSMVTARKPETGQVAVFRVRFAKPARPDLPSLVWAIVIEWPYDGDQMPPAEVNAAQQRFEQAADPLASSTHSELVHVSTGMGMKEWIFYARTREQFMKELNELLSGHPRYPLDIEFLEDPAWQVWEDAVKDLRRR